MVFQAKTEAKFFLFELPPRIEGKRGLDPSKPWDFISGLADGAMAEEEEEGGGSLLVLRLVGDIVRVNFENWSKG